MALGVVRLGRGSPERQVVVDLRQRRRTRRLGRLDWFEVAYRGYLVVLFGGGSVLWVSATIGDAPLDAAPLVRPVPSWIAVLAAVVVLAGLRAGTRGGPLAIEAADVVHVLGAPVERREVLLLPVVQRLRTVVVGGAVVGGVAGQLAARRLPGSIAAWACAGAASGALVGAVWMAAALLAHGRPRRVTGSVGVAFVVWQVVGVVSPLPTPLGPVGGLAVAAWPGAWRDAMSVSIIGAAAVPMVVAVTIGLLVVGVRGLDRMSPEVLLRRSALVAQLRFAATMQDLRTVVLLRRQLDEERPRHTAWFTPPIGRSAVWRRDWQGLARFPAVRIARMGAAAIVLGVSCGAVAEGTTTALAVAAVAGFVLGLEVLEPLAEEIDHPDLASLVPVESGEVMARHLAASAAALVPFALVAGGAAVAVVGAEHLVPVAVLCVPIVWGAACGAVVNVVRGAPDAPQSLVPPEVAGFAATVRALWPVIVSGVATSVVLIVRRAAEVGDGVAAAAVRAAIGPLLLAALIVGWVRVREQAHASIDRFMAEGRAHTAASRAGAR